MKKIIFLLVVSLTVINSLYSQNYDDGLVSSHLSVNTAQEKFVSYTNGFKSGLNKVKNGELTSADGIAAYYGFDIRKYSKLSHVLASTKNEGYSDDFSSNFITSLIEVIDKTDNEYQDIDQFRNALVKIAIAGNLSVKETEALAFIDISTQEIANNINSKEIAFQKHDYLSRNIVSSAKLNFSTPDSDIEEWVENIQEDKLPRWVRCALGTIGSAILGGLGGGAAGAQIGVAFGPLGAGIGAAVGGIGGFIGGAFTGVATFCD